MATQPLTPEQQRLTEPFQGHVTPWRKWGPYVSERAWVRCVKTTALMAKPGNISPTNMRAHAPIGGMRTDLLAFVTEHSDCVLLSPFGMDAIRF